MNKHEAKCTLRIVWHLLLCCCLFTAGTLIENFFAKVFLHETVFCTKVFSHQNGLKFFQKVGNFSKMDISLKKDLQFLHWALDATFPRIRYLC